MTASSEVSFWRGFVGVDNLTGMVGRGDVTAGSVYIRLRRGRTSNQITHLRDLHVE